MMSKIPQRFKSPQGLAYIKMGSGPSLVLIHGVGLRLDAWLKQLDELAQHFTLYAVDMPGHGESDCFPQCRDIADYTDVIADWIATDVSKPVLIAGHSMGSMIALNFAIRYVKDCVGVIALNSVFRRSNEAKKAIQSRVEQMKDKLTIENVTAPVKRWFDYPLQGDDVQNAALCSEWLTKASSEGYFQAYEVFCSNDGPAIEDLTSLPLPAFFSTGKEDPNSTSVMSETMASLCPQGIVHLIDKARHMAPMTHSEELNPLIIKFGQECFALKQETSYERA
ncbi:alpha/beta hydrolase [Marinomonas sp. THO17]|uniref:alpha/beta fold hydrolase n=1 Tax=Marinomonas sp. THO17 TaxID=3149048 RepID=UPI00336BD02A